jgi:hypothetical protein
MRKEIKFHSAQLAETQCMACLAGRSGLLWAQPPARLTAQPKQPSWPGPRGRGRPVGHTVPEHAQSTRKGAVRMHGGKPTMAKTRAHLHDMTHGGVVHPPVKVIWAAEHRNGMATGEAGLTGTRRRSSKKRWHSGEEGAATLG